MFVTRLGSFIMKPLENWRFHNISELRFKCTENQVNIETSLFQSVSFVFLYFHLSRQKFAKSRQKCCRFEKRLYLCSAIQFLNYGNNIIITIRKVG